MRGESDEVLGSFLECQCQEGASLARQSDLLDLLPVDGMRSSRYIAEFRCRGLIENDAGEIVDFDRFAVGIWLPEDYLRRVDLTQVVTYLGPAPRVWHPNIRGPFMCLHIVPGTPLVDILYGCFELFTWNLKYTGDEGLNHAAAQWARRQDPRRFPLDRRPLRRRNLSLQFTPGGGTP